MIQTFFFQSFSFQTLVALTLAFILTACGSSNSDDNTGTTTYSLTTSISGSGSVTSSPSGINCSTDCSASFTENTQVTLTATPENGYLFNRWSGACNGGGTCNINMTESQSVSAVFVEETVNTTNYLLSVTITGSGSVASSLTGIDCGNDCSESYVENTQVTLTATPANSYQFDGWSDACNGTNNCNLNMTSSRNVSAVFSEIIVPPTNYALSVSVIGSGNVTSSSNGIDCGSDCSESYVENTQVTLTATPTNGYQFDGWSGACNGSTTCNVSMTQAQNVSATFSQTSVDTTPNNFSFNPQIDRPLDAWVESNSINVSGINSASAISIVGGEFAIDGNLYTASAQQINNGQSVTVRVRSSSTNATSTQTTLTIGSISATFTVITQSLSATYYVDQNHASASDSNSGTESEPWLTIQHAANQLTAGETVLVKQGSYTELSSAGPDTDIKALKPQNSGSAGNYITYKAYPGQEVILDPNNAGIGFLISGKHYIKIDGFIIRNVRGATDKSGGVVTTGGCSNIIVENNHIYNLDGIAGSNVAGIRFDRVIKPIARNNLIHDVLVNGQDNGNASAITSYAMEDVIIENNEMYNAHNGVYYKMSSGNIGALITKNIIHDTTRGIYYDVAGGGSPPHINQRVTQNIIYNTDDAIRLDASDASGTNNGFHIWNNTILANNTAIWFENVIDVNVYNNIVLGPLTKSAVRSGPSSVTINEINYNNYYNAEAFVLNLWHSTNERSYSDLSDWQNSESFDINSSISDPKLIDIMGYNFKLAPDSPMRNSGKNGSNIGAYINDTDVIGYVNKN